MFWNFTVNTDEFTNLSRSLYNEIIVFFLSKFVFHTFTKQRDESVFKITTYYLKYNLVMVQLYPGINH